MFVSNDKKYDPNDNKKFSRLVCFNACHDSVLSRVSTNGLNNTS